MMPLMLDLFAGLGGASQAMRDRGWTVTTVDADPRFATTITADVTGWRWESATPDLLWASPPCSDFARESMPWCRTGRTPDFALVDATIRLVREIRPRFWVLENVRGAQRWLGRAPAHYGPFYLWGWYPPFAATVPPFKERLTSRRQAERAKVPYDLSDALAEAVEDAMDCVPDGGEARTLWTP